MTCLLTRAFSRIEHFSGTSRHSQNSTQFVSKLRIQQICVALFLIKPVVGRHDALDILVGTYRRDRCVVDGAKLSPPDPLATHNRCNASATGPYRGYNPCYDPNAVYVGGSYVCSERDPDIQAALIRKFGRQKFWLSELPAKVIGGLWSTSLCARFDLSGFSVPPH
jgi:hypothetical protein